MPGSLTTTSVPISTSAHTAHFAGKTGHRSTRCFVSTGGWELRSSSPCRIRWMTRSHGMRVAGCFIGNPSKGRTARQRCDTSSLCRQNNRMKETFNIKKIKEDIYLITEPYFRENANLYVIVGNDRDLVIDAGLGVCDVREFLLQKGFKPDLF